MPSLVQNASVYAGDSLTLEFTVSENGSPKNLTGATLLYQVKTSVPIQKQNADMDLADVATGVVRVSLSETDTRVTAGKYAHALQVTLSGQTEHVSVGTLTVLGEIAV